jgi:hypothetical protein
MTMRHTPHAHNVRTEESVERQTPDPALSAPELGIEEQGPVIG